MDPKHRDRIAFVRVCSGRFERRDAGDARAHRARPMRLSAPQQFLARERSAVEEAWPGDVIGVMDRGTLRIGDTLSPRRATSSSRGIPRFAPEHFARIIAADPLQRKQLDAGLRQLTEEGAAQVFYTSGTDALARLRSSARSVMLQFDVMLHRLEHEYGAPCRLEKISAAIRAGSSGPMDEIERIARQRAPATVRLEGAVATRVRRALDASEHAATRVDADVQRGLPELSSFRRTHLAR